MHKEQVTQGVRLHVIDAGSIARDVLDTSGFDGRDDLFGQNAGDLDSVNARNIAVETLPPGNPAGGRVCQSDETLKDLAGALLDSIVVAQELEELFAVGTSLATEARTGKNNAADHAGTQRAVL